MALRFAVDPSSQCPVAPIHRAWVVLPNKVERKSIDPIEWFQGTAAVPYLEKGPLSKLADPRMGTRLNNAFGGPFNFIRFGFWFN